MVAMAVPSHGFREVLAEAAPAIATDAILVSLTKGIEQGTLARMSQVVEAVLPRVVPDTIAVLTGPNLVREIAEGQPTASVVATRDDHVGAMLQKLFMTGTPPVGGQSGYHP